VSDRDSVQWHTRDCRATSFSLGSPAWLRGHSDARRTDRCARHRCGDAVADFARKWTL